MWPSEKEERLEANNSPRRSRSHGLTSLLGLTIIFVIYQVFSKPYSFSIGHERALGWHVCSAKELTENSSRSTPSLQCTRMDVPLSYVKGDHRTISLPLARLPADPSVSTTGPPIFLNPGGPGGSGVGFMSSTSVQQIWHLFNGTRELISFDPRGVKDSSPAFSCYKTPAARQSAIASSGGLLRSAKDSFIRALGTNRVRSLGCLEYSSELGEHLSTTYVARDMRHLAAKVYNAEAKHGKHKRVTEENVKLDYWGFSYGTALGMTYAALLPDNVGTFVLDGVCDLEDYLAGGWYSNLEKSDDVIREFYESCALNPERCVLATMNGTRQTATTIEGMVTTYLQDLKESPVAAWDEAAGEGGLITYSFLKTVMWRQFYAPKKWPQLARSIHALLSGEPDRFYAQFRELETILSNEGGIGTLCGDSWQADDPVSRSIDYMQNVTETIERQSMFGGDYWAQIPLRCQYYPFTPERLEMSTLEDGRDARKEVSRRILFVGNDYDLVTPLGNARRMSNLFFPGSRVLRNEAMYGHCSSAQKSTCAESKIREWFLTSAGADFANETLCTVDEGHGAFESQAVTSASIADDEDDNFERFVF